jgi:CRP/FNR family cyclic AMP-dependent transcriptional regulator
MRSHAKSLMAHRRASRREQEPRVQPAQAAAPRVTALGDFGHLDVLKAISPAHRRSIFAECVSRQCKRGASILNQGDRADFVAFVAQGQAITLYHAPSGRVGASGIWTVGDILGASYIHNPASRQTTVKSIEPMTLYCLPHATLLRITHAMPDFGEAMLKAVSARLRWAHNLTHILQTLPAFGRVCAILVSLADRYGVEVEDGVLVNVSLTHEHLAAFVGVTRQFATVTLHQLVHEELITVRRRKIVVHDLTRLRRRAGAF